MRTYVVSCDECGMTTPPIPLPGTAGRVRRAHRCETTCLHCGWRQQGKRSRGLCDRCYRDPEIRLDYRLPTIHRASDLIEDVEWLLGDGANLTTALARLSIKKDALWRACKRADRMDLFDQLADREPDAEMRRKVRDHFRATA